MLSLLQKVHDKSIQHPEDFWAEAAEAIDWQKSWDQVLSQPQPNRYRWFAGAECNTCYNAVDRHVEKGRGNQPAIIYDSPVTKSKKTISYSELQQQVARFAGVLFKYGVGKGDRVIIYMPMIPQSVVAMLACARLGAVHSVVFGGFAAKEIAGRIEHARPKVIVTATCGIEVERIVDYTALLHEALNIAEHQPNKCIVFQRPQHKVELDPDIYTDFAQEQKQAQERPCVTVAATDPLYILYTSGTTGHPKGVVRDNGGHMVALSWTMKNIYNIEAGKVYWAASDIGWVVGHSYIVYAPLIFGCTTVLYEGKPVGTPDAGAFWRVVEEHKVHTLFTAPTSLRAIKREDPEAEELKKYDISSLKSLFLAGERADSDTISWAEKKLKIPVIDHWWQTETGWAITANPLGIEKLPVKAGSSTKAVPGYDLLIVNEASERVSADQTGSIIIKLPLPPGSLTTLWQADEQFQENYLAEYPGYYKTGDAGYVDEDGYLFIMSRLDDIINIAGHRLSTGAIEEVLSNMPEVAECAVIGIRDQLKGQLPMGFLVLKKGVKDPEEDIAKRATAAVRRDIGPVAAFKSVVVVGRLPKTRSGKILRATMRSIINGEDFKVPPTIDDPAILDEIASIAARR